MEKRPHPNVCETDRLTAIGELTPSCHILGILNTGENGDLDDFIRRVSVATGWVVGSTSPQ